MSGIEMDRDSMRWVLKKTEEHADDVSSILSGFSSTADGGIASDKIAFIVRAALEAAQLSADSVQGLCDVASLAVDDQTATESDILESLNNFAGKEFD